MHISVCMGKIVTTLCCLSSIALIAGARAAAEVSFQASVDKVETAYEEKVLLDLIVTVSDAALETRPLSPPAMVGFRIGGSTSSVTQEAGTIVRHYQYELIPARSGPVEIPAFALEYSDSAAVDTLYSQPITVSVAQPIPPEEEGGTHWAIYVIAGVFLAVGVWWWIRRREVANKVPAEPEWQSVYRKQLEEIIDVAERQNYREFFDKGSRLLVGLLERSFETPLKGKTVDNLCQWVERQEIPDELKNMITDFLKSSESVKFTSAPVEPRAAEGRVGELKKIVERLLV